MNKIKLSVMLVLLNLSSIFAVELYTNIGTTMDATIYMNQFTAVDSLKNGYTKTVNLKFYLADSADINYLSCIDGFSIYKIGNHLRHNVKAEIIHNDVWLNAFCKHSGFDSLPLLKVNRSDSTAYFWGIVDSELTADSNNALISAKYNLSGCRMFTKWDAEKKKAYTTITLMIILKSDGVLFTLDNTDSLTFSMEIVTLRAVDSKNRVWCVNSPKVATSQRHSVIERKSINSYSVLIPFVTKKTTSKWIYRLDGKSIKSGINLRNIAISPGEYQR